jgi:hypothetical protein
MNVSLDLDSTHRERQKVRSRSSCGCDLDCQEELFGHLADRSQLSIMQTLCEGAKTDVQIATATGLSQSDISFSYWAAAAYRRKIRDIWFSTG